MILHLHRWTRWRNMPIRLTLDGAPVGTVSGQVRTCETCGKEKLRRV